MGCPNHPLEREHVVTPRYASTAKPDRKALLRDDADRMREIVRTAATGSLEVEMSEALGAERTERTEDHLSYLFSRAIDLTPVHGRSNSWGRLWLETDGTMPSLQRTSCWDAPRSRSQRRC